MLVASLIVAIASFLNLSLAEAGEFEKQRAAASLIVSLGLEARISLLAEQSSKNLADRLAKRRAFDDVKKEEIERDVLQSTSKITTDWSAAVQRHLMSNFNESELIRLAAWYEKHRVEIPGLLQPAPFPESKKLKEIIESKDFFELNQDHMMKLFTFVAMAGSSL